jgi:hypothetical protein
MTGQNWCAVFPPKWRLNRHLGGKTLPTVQNSALCSIPYCWKRSRRYTLGSTFVRWVASDDFHLMSCIWWHQSIYNQFYILFIKTKTYLLDDFCLISHIRWLLFGELHLMTSIRWVASDELHLMTSIKMQSVLYFIYQNQNISIRWLLSGELHLMTSIRWVAPDDFHLVTSIKRLFS